MQLSRLVLGLYLPTEPSTYFYTANADEKVEVLGKRQNYIKVLFSDGKIGWVNKDDLQKIKALYFWIFCFKCCFGDFCFCFTKSQNTLWKIRKFGLISKIYYLL